MRDRQARSCYGHLAGVWGVALTQEMITRGWFATRVEGERTHFDVTPLGAEGLAAIGIDATLRPSTKRLYAYGCVDRTEKVHHLGGYLGEQVLQHFLERGWVARPYGDRVLEITANGEEQCELLRSIKDKGVLTR
ncbi:MAG: hypothetical protein ACXVDB_09265 [Tumebacillaceae bacterium]